ncbi:MULTISPECIES: hypothetical protein [unclassified Mycolicibacterium]|uniref:hypothetical protein n=1 Tax=unclassified Mycolicibacterium TaxID=2636767 RepID=UPI0012DDBC03|nr:MULTISPECIES: hypothetical protein [unclassified Mycolicibacterium]MUL83470.1 hypothetical protein [Mycolicibacterium sp. CBMA 329]MUL90461.1 hypothetical protein [Mycolicibacterium sp. CBMA 331]MUM00433.1 hypothetical protein [Mycolicibacterium sp. CBMA 334]MUM28728.1 hypothetical protein [Mycolicibacterium sp. CBMA 295]MUM41405.1 hypothetical protein [Mycolicibacterium sp. CBMA 247]
MAVIMPAIAIGGAPLATAVPTPGGQPADQIIQELSSDGYTVAINWVGGTSTLPLSLCRVNAIHNPNRGVPALPRRSVTVYVDVQCPDEGSNS